MTRYRATQTSVGCIFSIFFFVLFPVSRAVWFSGISDESERANCACNIACFQSRAGGVPVGTEESTHSKRCTRNAISARLCRVILPIWPFLSRGRKSPGVQLVCETAGPARIAAKCSGGKKLTRIKLLCKTDCLQLDVLNFITRC